MELTWNAEDGMMSRMVISLAADRPQQRCRETWARTASRAVASSMLGKAVPAVSLRVEGSLLPGGTAGGGGLIRADESSKRHLNGPVDLNGLTKRKKNLLGSYVTSS